MPKRKTIAGLVAMQAKRIRKARTRKPNFVEDINRNRKQLKKVKKK